MWDITRNQWFLMGFVLLLLGGQFRLVESADLTPEFTHFLAQRAGGQYAAATTAAKTFAGSDQPVIKKRVRPPEFLGWALLSLGAVLVLHSWGMKAEGSG
jgi:hypothetical protein